MEEQARRSQLLNGKYQNYSFTSRPVRLDKSEEDSLFRFIQLKKRENVRKVEFHSIFTLLPILNSTVFNSTRPYGWGNYSLQNGKGLQNLFSPGAFFKFYFLEIQLRPEFILAQNKPYQGYPDIFSDNINFARFRFWNFGDHPERFPGKYNTFATWGQSYISLNFNKVELGFSTQNLWWGPGQFSSLIFSNNARGIKHIFLKTKSPVNIGIGLLEAQLILGRAEDSGLSPSQNEKLNNQYFIKFNGDWRYISGISIAYQPRFLKGITVGFNRVFQQYNQNVPKSLLGRLPVFQVFQKEKLFENGNSVTYDQQAQDQLASLFFRYKNEKGRFDIYSEFGKHDHNFNWRDFFLNPEHARAFLLGFQELIPLHVKEKYFQVRGEIIHQEESVNRYIRYPVLGVLNTSWQTHYQVRGFTNHGESMGPGIGVGTNAQILELALVKGYSKKGILLERLANHQDFFYRAFGRTSGRQPWIDYSIGLLWDQSFEKLTLGTKIQLISSYNYQWQSNLSSSRDFPQKNLDLALYLNLNLLYRFGD